ncbi:exonuclease SbcCD subunit D [Xylocopilactobacillus apicola]|uniref:Nuclease SbcCD subunit D n=1 Tax=Xylocopilactobacillus apicola TaxID=2932184 RepID=A0AAU9DAH2_9LACO|nr:exonuclease SbcCD subunit D [Xylocopilactobacillus apicola]BDR57842.1 nuclease SbcCD subunit D [Xylocopilactobacillus apicola]
MRFIHTADWHIGRKLNGFDLLADQEAVFQKLVEVIKSQHVDAVVIAGDLYDRSLASEESVASLNQMLFCLNRELDLPLLVISGNHDSATRLSTGRQWFNQTQFFLNTQLKDAFEPVELGQTQFFLLPYFEPAQAREFFKDESLRTLNQAMPKVMKMLTKNFDPTKHHVLVGHFFAAGSTHTDSEIMVNVGGLDAVSLADLADFDYVALGHLHNRKAINEEKVQYAGSLLKFSVSEATQAKGVYLVNTETFERKFIELEPKHDLVHLTKSFAELTDPNFYHQINRDDFLALTLTDRDVITDAMAKLRDIYPHIIGVDRQHGVKLAHALNPQTVKLEPLNLLNRYYEETTGNKLSKQQLNWAQETLDSVKEENDAAN